MTNCTRSSSLSTKRQTKGVIPVWRDFLTSDAVRTNHTVQRGASCVGALFLAHPEARNSVEITGKWKNCGSSSVFFAKTREIGDHRRSGSKINSQLQGIKKSAIRHTESTPQTKAPRPLSMFILRYIDQNAWRTIATW